MKARIKMRTLQTCAAAAILSSCAGLALAGGTITNGNASFQLVGIPALSTNNGDCTLLTDTGAPDQSSKFTWYYRLQNNNQNRFMSFIDTPVETYVGDTSTITYTNAGPGVAGFERFNAGIVTKIADGGTPNQVRVTSTCTFSSAATSLRTYQVFLLVDLDLAGGVPNPGPDDAMSFDLPTFTATQTEASSSNFAKIAALAPTRWQVGTSAALRTLLNGGSANLSNAVAPLTGVDTAIAFQWTLELTPGQEAQLSGAFAINQDAFEPACVADFDDGSGTGTPDGGVGIEDLLYYLTLFEGGVIGADVDDGSSTGTPDGGVGIEDLLYFLVRFENGC